jgi:hypothetical protein
MPTPQVKIEIWGAGILHNNGLETRHDLVFRLRMQNWRSRAMWLGEFSRSR